eukprot:5231115-Amphidinium_carterae.1
MPSNGLSSEQVSTTGALLCHCRCVECARPKNTQCRIQELSGCLANDELLREEVGLAFSFATV